MNRTTITKKAIVTDHTTGIVYPSLRDCAKALGGSKQGVWKACTTGGTCRGHRVTSEVTEIVREYVSKEPKYPLHPYHPKAKYKAIIYKITNNKSDSVYIGATTQTLGRRFSSHKATAKNWERHFTHQMPLIVLTMRELGYDNFKIEELHYAEFSKKAERDEWMHKMESMEIAAVRPDLLLNETTGVQGKSPISIKVDDKVFESMSDAGRFLHTNATTIGAAVRGNRKYKGHVLAIV